jgi:outer membrane protein assembly factor BamB
LGKRRKITGKKPRLQILLAAILLLCTHAGRSVELQSEALSYWPQWRGPLMTGEAPRGDPPIRWSETGNIRWKIPVPGMGHATPVVWGDRIFVLTAVPARNSQGKDPGDRVVNMGNDYSYEVLAMNRKDGSLIWRRVARVEAPHEGRHPDASWASCSPVTDGKHVIASFGSRGFYCYDMDGILQWEKDFGDLHIRYSWGEGSSPALSGDKLIVTWDHTGNSFVAVLDKRTGRELWRKSRNDGTSWTTPLVVEHNGRKQIIAPSIRRTRCYDLETGKELWTTRGMTANPIPTPVSANGIVYLMGGYRESVLQAISLDKAHGSASSSGAILWEQSWDTPYVPSPLLYGGNLYFLKSNQNILSCLDAATGKSYYSRQRLNNIQGVYASPVAAKDRIYVLGRNGVCVVIRHGPRLEILATNRLDDSFSASPVIVGKDLYLRGHKYLYCISSE